MKYKNGERMINRIFNVALIIVIIVSIYPIWFTVIASVSNPSAISNGEVVLIPKGFNLSAYRKMLDNSQIWIGYRNSILYTFFGTIVNLVVQIPCAYALSRKKLPGRRGLMFLFTFTMYFSGGMIPQFLLINKLGLINSPLALIVPSALSVYNVIVARSFFEGSIPESLYEAARIDGCSYTRFFLQIVVPLSGAMIAIITLFCVQAHWNVYLSAAMYIYDSRYYNLQQVIKAITATLDSGLVETMSTEEMVRLMQEKQLMKYAVVVVSCVPLIAIYPFVQKFFVKGVMIGAVKG